MGFFRGLRMLIANALILLAKGIQHLISALRKQATWDIVGTQGSLLSC